MSEEVILMYYTVHVEKVKHDTGIEGYALVDDTGRLIEPRDYREILTTVKAFYDELLSHYNPGYVYLLQAGPYYKIGLTRNLDQRVKTLSTLPPFDLELVCAIRTGDMYTLERELHQRFKGKRKNGEWFELDPNDVEYIRELAI